MRKSERILNLELEVYKLRIELDLLYDLLNYIADTNDAKSMDAGKWYVRKQRSDNDN